MAKYDYFTHSLVEASSLIRIQRVGTVAVCVQRMVEALGLWGRRLASLNQAQARGHLGGVLGGAQPSVRQLGQVLGGVQPSVHQLSEVLGHGEGLLGITESLDRPVGEGGHDLAAAGLPAAAQPRNCSGNTSIR